ncbi:hypothetical protein [Achromobacter sp.]
MKYFRTLAPVDPNHQADQRRPVIAFAAFLGNSQEGIDLDIFRLPRS